MVKDVCDVLQMFKLIEKYKGSKAVNELKNMFSTDDYSCINYYILDFIYSLCDGKVEELYDDYRQMDSIYIGVDCVKEYFDLANKYGSVKKLKKNENPYIAKAREFLNFEFSDASVWYCIDFKNNFSRFGVQIDINSEYDSLPLLEAICSSLNHFRTNLSELRREYDKLTKRGRNDGQINNND